MQEIAARDIFEPRALFVAIRSISSHGRNLTSPYHPPSRRPLAPSLTSNVILEFSTIARGKHVVPVALVDLVANLDEVAQFKCGAFADELFAVLNVVSYLY
jgi:hypothetical protein